MSPRSPLAGSLCPAASRLLLHLPPAIAASLPRPPPRRLSALSPHREQKAVFLILFVCLLCWELTTAVFPERRLHKGAEHGRAFCKASHAPALLPSPFARAASLSSSARGSLSLPKLRRQLDIPGVAARRSDQVTAQMPAGPPAPPFPSLPAHEQQREPRPRQRPSPRAPRR